LEYLTDEDYETAERNGIARKAAYHRFYILCWDRLKAITTPVKHHHNLWDDYKDRSKVAKTTFYERVRKGMTPEEAASLSPLPLGNPLRAKGKGKISLVDFKVAEENGISENTLKARVYQYRWPVELAVAVPVGKKRPNRRRLRA
jgi:hypothetical protein